MSLPRKKRILVTGAAGYIGRLVVADLIQRTNEVDTVVALDIAHPDGSGDTPRAIRVQGDICSGDLGRLFAEHGIDTVVHLATIVRAPRGAPSDLAFRVDVEGTRNVLEACVQNCVDRLIVTSSGAAYGYHQDNPSWLQEDDALRGNADFPYAHHKRLVEEMLAEARKRHPELEQVVFRPGTVLGESVHSPITDLFEKPAVMGIMGSESPFVFIWDHDVVSSLAAAIFGGPPGVFNLAGDGALSPREIARILKKPYLPLPARLVAAVLFVLKKLGVTEHGPERVKFLQHRPVLDNQKLKEAFGFVPKMTSREAFNFYATKRGLLAP
jgi:UDP-glucose 4-epimerase